MRLIRTPVVEAKYTLQAVLLLAAVLVACGPQTTEDQPTTTTEAVTTTTRATTTTTVPVTTTTTEPEIEWDYSPSDSPPVITLLDAGAEPRQQLEYAYSNGAVGTTTMHFGITQVQVTDDVIDSETRLDLDMEVTVEVVDIVPEGFVTLSTYGDFRANASDPSVEAAMEISLGALTESASQLALMAPDGRILAIGADSQIEGFADLTQAFANAVAPLPTDAVGIGAQWQVANSIETFGIEMVQTSVVTVREIEGTRVVVDIEVMQEQGPEGLSLPGLETADEILLVASGSGEAVWDLAQPVPVAASSDSEQTLEVTFSVGDEQSTFSQDSFFRLEVPSPAVGLGESVPDHFVSTFDLNEGDCYDDTDYPLHALLVPCAGPHDFEVYAVLTSPEPAGATAPDADQVSAGVRGRCGSALGRVDLELVSGLAWTVVAYPLPPFWDQGRRSTICSLYAEDATKVTGSRLLAHSRFDSLGDREFAGGEREVLFPGATSNDELALIGSAQRENEALVLTAFAEHAERGVPFQQERLQRGAAWLLEPVSVVDGFTTAFVFQFEMYSWFTVGNGLAFVVQGGGADVLGDGIGYDGMPNSIAIEFDTLKEDWLQDPLNAIPDAPDLMANHVAVHSRGELANDTHHTASLDWANIAGFYMADRAPHVALIVYEPGELAVYIDDFDIPILVVEVDLSQLLSLSDGRAYVGFTASSGPDTSRGPGVNTITGHKILRWEFASGR